MLAAVYACYAAGWDDGVDDRAALTTEAIFLARTLVQLAPDEPEAHGLLALMLHAEARKQARRGPDGAYVPLDRQDCSLWDTALIREADAHLVAAGGLERFGRYQCEAAIQSVHAARAVTGGTDWQALATLYGALTRLSPSIGAAVSHAAVAAHSEDNTAALRMLDALDPDRVNAYQPYWAVRASILRGLGQIDDCASAYAIAAGMTQDAAVREHLLAERRSMLEESGNLN